MAAQSLYRIRVKSLTAPDGIESLVCRQCASHAQYISESQGPRWYIRGNPFEYVAPFVKAGSMLLPQPECQGECDRCEDRKQSEARIISNIEGITYGAALRSIR